MWGYAIVFVFALATVTTAYGGTCSREEHCVPISKDRQRCTITGVGAHVVNGRCQKPVMKYVIIKAIIPPREGPNRPPDPRCADLTPAQRAETDACQ